LFFCFFLIHIAVNSILVSSFNGKSSWSACIS